MVARQEQDSRMAAHDLDEDLAGLDRNALLAEVRRLRAGIRQHRDSVGHELCWHHPQLWGLLPEKTDPQPRVPEWPQFLRGCIEYRESLDQQLPRTPRTQDEFTDASQPVPGIDFANLPAPQEDILVTLFITVRKVARSRDFYSRVLGGTVVIDENPCIVITRVFRA